MSLGIMFENEDQDISEDSGGDGDPKEALLFIIALACWILLLSISYRYLSSWLLWLVDIILTLLVYLGFRSLSIWMRSHDIWFKKSDFQTLDINADPLRYGGRQKLQRPDQ